MKLFLLRKNFYKEEEKNGKLYKMMRDKTLLLEIEI